MTALGIYLLSSLVFTVGALLEFAAVIVVDRFNNSKKEDILKKESTLCTTSHYFDKQAPITSIRMRNVAGGKAHLFEMNRTGLSIAPDTKTNEGRPYFSVDKIDLAAFWTYLTIYLFFNLVYWVSYMN